jgi:CelD/BcsL family acetyltransferase involved in cellulose biosynthesis
MISVTLAKPDASLEAHWDALRPFAHNVFLHPAALRAASETMIAVITVLLAWDLSVEPNKLVGLWAVQGRQLFLWPFLEALPFNYSFLSTPILNPDYAEEAMPAFLAAIAREKSLPNTLIFRDLDAAGREHSAITQAVARHPQLELRSDERPIATRESGLKRSGSTRKKLRQDWNKLAGAGAVEVVNVRDARTIGEAFESFLLMEQKSWKGAGGTALLSNPHDATFARRFIHDMAARGEASVALLTLDGKPIAAQVLLYGNRIAYTWKTSFDPDLARYSPGTLLVDKISMDLIDSGEVDAFDSCARGDSFMAQLWSGRKPMVDFITTATPHRSVGYAAISGYFRAREGLKALRDGMRRKPKPAATATQTSAAASTVPTPPAASAPKPKADRAA